MWRIMTFGLIAWLLWPSGASAHCDTLNGPVVRDAKIALQRGDVTPALKWVRKTDEVAVRATFKTALAAQRTDTPRREAAELRFFDTVVQLHRTGEGAVYTGLQPAPAEPDPVVLNTDEALETGSPEALVNLVTNDMARGLRDRFARALEKKRHADDSVEAGREFVAAYVELIHYAEQLHQAADPAQPPGAAIGERHHHE